ncbi:hypothetical protein HIM_01307 [Hirsutella minnesotensis 3608]|nr:hypothetical protein HIM_01307 [Hirsutella minnesotensis 3608]
MTLRHMDQQAHVKDKAEQLKSPASCPSLRSTSRSTGSWRSSSSRERSWRSSSSPERSWRSSSSPERSWRSSSPPESKWRSSSGQSRASLKHNNPCGWLWKDVKSNHLISSIPQEDITPSAHQVTSKGQYEVLGNYSWKTGSTVDYAIPGSAPKWRDEVRAELPFALPKTKEPFGQVEADNVLPAAYDFKPLFDATATMTPEFRFDAIDVVIGRNSVRKLFDFCAGKKACFRLNLAVINNTLFVSRYERNRSIEVTGSSREGWGHVFERTCVELPDDALESPGHHQCLRYQLGGLNCVVRCEVDAFYKATREDHDHTASDMRPAGTEVHRLAAAEIKTCQKREDKNTHMPQLWFGRTRWLMSGRHTNGHFENIKIEDAGLYFEKWETTHQERLRKLVTVLEQLQQAVKKSDSGNCVVIYDGKAGSRALRVFESKVRDEPLPESYKQRFWNRD